MERFRVGTMKKYDISTGNGNRFKELYVSGICRGIVKLLIVIMCFIIFVSKPGDAQRLSNRDMGNIAPIRPGLPPFQTSRNNYPSFWSEHQRRLEELEKKIEEQRRLANEIAKRQAELMRLQSLNRNFDPQTTNTRIFPNAIGENVRPNGIHLNRPHLSRPSDIGTSSDIGPSNVTVTDFRHNEQWGSRFIGENISRNTPFDNNQGTIISNSNQQTAHAISFTRTNPHTNKNNLSDRTMILVNNGRGYVDMNRNSAMNVNNRFSFQNQRNSHLHKSNLETTDQLSSSSSRTMGRDLSLQTVQGIPIPNRVHHMVSFENLRRGSNFQKQDQNRRSEGLNVIRQGSIIKMNDIKSEDANWKKQGKDPSILGLSKGLVIGNDNNLMSKENVLRNNQRMSLVKPLQTLQNLQRGHEEISVFQPKAPSVQVEVKPSIERSMETEATNVIPYANFPKNHSSVAMNVALKVAQDDQNKNLEAYKPDTAIVIRYKNGQVQTDTEHYVKVQNRSLVGNDYSNSQNTMGAESDRFVDKTNHNRSLHTSLVYPLQPSVKEPNVVINIPDVSNQPNLHVSDKHNLRTHDTMQLSELDQQKHMDKESISPNLSLRVANFVPNKLSNAGPLSLPQQNQSPVVVENPSNLPNIDITNHNSALTPGGLNSRDGTFSPQFSPNVRSIVGPFHNVLKPAAFGSSSNTVPSSLEEEYLPLNNQGQQRKFERSSVLTGRLHRPLQLLQQNQQPLQRQHQQPQQLNYHHQQQQWKSFLAQPTLQHHKPPQQPIRQQQLKSFVNPRVQQHQINNQQLSHHEQQRQAFVMHQNDNQNLAQLSDKHQTHTSPESLRIHLAIDKQNTHPKRQYSLNQDNLNSQKIHQNIGRQNMASSQWSQQNVVPEAVVQVQHFPQSNFVQQATPQYQVPSSKNPVETSLTYNAEQQPVIQVVETPAQSVNNQMQPEILQHSAPPYVAPNKIHDANNEQQIPKTYTVVNLAQVNERSSPNKEKDLAVTVASQKQDASDNKALIKALLALLQDTKTSASNDHTPVVQTEGSTIKNAIVKTPIQEQTPPNSQPDVQTLQQAVVQTVDNSNLISQSLPANLPEVPQLNILQAFQVPVAPQVVPVPEANLNPQVASPLVPQMQSPFGFQMGNFVPGMGNMWGFGSQNPNAATQMSMWHQLMFGDSIDIPDPPDPTPNTIHSTTVISGPAGSAKPAPMVPFKIETEAEGSPPETTEATTTTTTTTTTTPKPKTNSKSSPKPKNMIQDNKSSPDIINTIALKLAALLGKTAAAPPVQATEPVKADVVSEELVIKKAKTVNNSTVNVQHEPLKETVLTKTVQVNSNYAKPVEINNQNQNLQLPVTFLSGKVPKQRNQPQTLVNIHHKNELNPKDNPILAGVDVKSVKAKQIGTRPEVIKADKVNLNIFGNLKQFQPAITPQPVIEVQSDSLTDLTSVIAGKNTLDNIVSVDMSLKSDSLQYSPNKHKNSEANFQSAGVAEEAILITTSSPLVVNYQNVAPVPSVARVKDSANNNDTNAVIKNAVVDLLSQIKQLWTNSDLSPATITTTTTEKPCTPDSPEYTCEGVGMFATVTTIATWCLEKCRAGACVESVCKCSCPPSPALEAAGWQGGTTESALGSLDRANTTDVPEEIEWAHLNKRTPAQKRRARKYAHLCHPLAMIHNEVCGDGPNDPKCPVGAKCIIIPKGDNFCCWQDRELPGPAPQKRRPRKGFRRRKWRRPRRHRRMSTPIMSTHKPSEEEEEVEQEDMVSTTPQFTTESPMTSTWPYYDVIEPTTTTVSFADVKLSAYDVIKQKDFKFDSTSDFVLSTPGFAKDSVKYKDEFSPSDIHWGSDRKGRVKEIPKSKPVGPTSGYDLLGINPDTLGFVPDIERSRWERTKKTSSASKSSRWNDPGWNRRDGSWRDPPPTDWRDPPPRDSWGNRDRHYDPWRDAPPPTPRPTERAWGRSSRWRDSSPPIREHGPPRDWAPLDHWGRGSGLRDSWRETTTKANEEEQEGAEGND